MIKVLTLKNEKEWRVYLEKLPRSERDIYYTPEYYRFFKEHGDGEPHCIVYEQGELLVLYPFLLNNINCLGYDLESQYYDIQGVYGYNGIISNLPKAVCQSEFYREYDLWVKSKNIVSEFLRFNPYLKNVELSSCYYTTILNRYTVLLELNQTYDNIWRYCYSNKNRNNKNNIKIEFGSSKEYIDKFYNTYLSAMKKIGADNYYYFKKNLFLRHFNKSEHFKYIIAVKEGIVVATMLLIHYHEYAHYHLSGKSPECTDNSTVNIMLDEAIKYSMNCGANKFHFGGGLSISKDDPLFKYKSNFSKTILSHYIGKNIYNSDIYESIIDQYRQKHPLLYAKYKNVLQVYRYI